MHLLSLLFTSILVASAGFAQESEADAPESEAEVPEVEVPEAAPTRSYRLDPTKSWLYVLVYYGLWASADVLILSGVDAGWLLRVVPNQLYYALWTAFVYARFYSVAAEPPNAAR